MVDFFRFYKLQTQICCLFLLLSFGCTTPAFLIPPPKELPLGKKLAMLMKYQIVDLETSEKYEKKCLILKDASGKALKKIWVGKWSKSCKGHVAHIRSTEGFPSTVILQDGTKVGEIKDLLPVLSKDSKTTSLIRDMYLFRRNKNISYGAGFAGSVVLGGGLAFLGVYFNNQDAKNGTSVGNALVYTGVGIGVLGALSSGITAAVFESKERAAKRKALGRYNFDLFVPYLKPQKEKKRKKVQQKAKKVVPKKKLQQTQPHEKQKRAKKTDSSKPKDKKIKDKAVKKEDKKNDLKKRKMKIDFVRTKKTKENNKAKEQK